MSQFRCCNTNVLISYYRTLLFGTVGMLGLISTTHLHHVRQPRRFFARQDFSIFCTTPALVKTVFSVASVTSILFDGHNTTPQLYNGMCVCVSVHVCAHFMVFSLLFLLSPDANILCELSFINLDQNYDLTSDIAHTLLYQHKRMHFC